MIRFHHQEGIFPCLWQGLGSASSPVQMTAPPPHHRGQGITARPLQGHPLHYLTSSTSQTRTNSTPHMCHVTPQRTHHATRASTPESTPDNFIQEPGRNSGNQTGAQGLQESLKRTGEHATTPPHTERPTPSLLTPQHHCYPLTCRQTLTWNQGDTMPTCTAEEAELSDPSTCPKPTRPRTGDSNSEKTVLSDNEQDDALDALTYIRAPT